MLRENTEFRVYVGSYTKESLGEGISLARVTADGGFRVSETFRGVADPSFLALAPDKNVLYAVNELAAGRVMAFSIAEDGSLRELNSQPTWGSAPCYVSVHPSGDYLFTANYLSGSFVVHPLGPTGVIREPCHLVQHSGSGPDKDRQQGPHVHQVVPAPSGRHVLTVDLGKDTVTVYDFDGDTGHLALRTELMLPPGHGPRHLAFDPSAVSEGAGQRYYLVSELASTISEIDCDLHTGEVALRRTVSTLPADFRGENLAAAIVVSPDGRFVFGSNRGHDSVAVFEADGLRLVRHEPARVAQPRHMQLSPDGRFLLVAGQHSSTVQVFRVEASGALRPVGEPVPVSCPACVLPVAS